MAVFALPGQQNVLASGYKSAMVISGFTSNPRRCKIFDINMSQSGAPASTDTNIQFDLSIITILGTSTGYTPLANDPADATLTTVCGVNTTIEGTVTANSSKFNIGLNQRAPYRWQTYLGSGGEIVMPATSSQGLTFRALSAGYTGAAGGTMYVQEQ